LSTVRNRDTKLREKTTNKTDSTEVRMGRVLVEEVKKQNDAQGQVYG